MIRRFVEGIVGFSIRQPWLVVLFAIGILFGASQYTKRLELRSDFLELLPRDSPGFIAFEQQLKRVGGGATLIVVVESPDRKANEKLIDDISGQVIDLAEARKKCAAEGKGDACGPELVSYVENGTKEVRKFFQDNKWLYADLADLENADQTLDHQIAIKSGMVSDLESDDDDDDAPKKKKTDKPSAAHPDSKPTLGMDEYHDRWQSKADKHDDFPTGYFATVDGTMLGFRIVSPTTGTGDRGGDILLAKVQEIVSQLDVAKYNPQM